MNRNIIMLLISLILISGISIVVAEDTNETSENLTGTYIGSVNHTYDVNTSENTTLNGFCLDYTADAPHLNGNESTTFNISKNTSNVQNSVKELIVRYYDEKNYENNNFALQLAIWTITNNDHFSLDLNPYNLMYDTHLMAYNMKNSLTGLVIGDFYSFDNGTHTRNFTFYFGSPNDNEIQNLILFDYVFGETPTPNNNTTETPVNNTTMPTNNTTETSTDNSTNNTLINNEEEETSTNNSTNNALINNEEEASNTTEPLNIAKVIMQKTGIPIITLLLVLLVSLGLITRKKL
jgi:hypothetical protein